MTVQAHDVRYVNRGATRTGEMTRRTGGRFSLYRELHPEMYRSDTRRVLTLADRVAEYIQRNEGTIDEIAIALQCDKSSVARLFNRGVIPGAVVVGSKTMGRQKVNVWGVE